MRFNNINNYLKTSVSKSFGVGNMATPKFIPLSFPCQFAILTQIIDLLLNWSSKYISGRQN